MDNVIKFPTAPLEKTFNNGLNRMREAGMTEQQISDWIMETVKEMGLVQNANGVWCLPGEVK